MASADPIFRQAWGNVIGAGFCSAGSCERPRIAINPKRIFHCSGTRPTRHPKSEQHRALDCGEVKVLVGGAWRLCIQTRKKRAVDAAASAPPTIITRYPIHAPSAGAGLAARSISFTSFGSTICTPSAKDVPETPSVAS